MSEVRYPRQTRRERLRPVSAAGAASPGGLWYLTSASRIAAGLGLALALAACASLPAGPVDAPAVYRARCALCHPPWSPTDFAAAEWPRYVRKYAPRAGLTQAERDAVLAYLVREAERR
jgi:hypothetical protein